MKSIIYIQFEIWLAPFFNHRTADVLINKLYDICKERKNFHEPKKPTNNKKQLNKYENFIAYLIHFIVHGGPNFPFPKVKVKWFIYRTFRLRRSFPLVLLLLRF